MSDLSADLAIAIALARSAGAIARRGFGQAERLTKSHAATTDEAVTEADRACQRHIIAGLRERFPDDGVIGEENDDGSAITHLRSAHPHDSTRGDDGRTWVIDPIDGTNNYVAGLGSYAVCIGRLDEGEPTLGVVYDVERDQVHAGARGCGAWLDGRRVTAATTPLSERSLLMLTSNLIDAHGRLPPWATRWFASAPWKIRILGSAALEAVQVAAGVAHGAITVHGKLWDAAAAAAVITAAGGVITSLDGRPIFPFPVRGYAGTKVPFLAAGPAAHGRLIEEIARDSLDG